MPLFAKANSIVKANLQEGKAGRQLRAYRAEAVKKGLECLEEKKLKQSLQKRLAHRRSVHRLKSKGDLHIFLAYYVSSWESVLPRSLEPFGKVTVFNWREHGFKYNNRRRFVYIPCRRFVLAEQPYHWRLHRNLPRY